MAEIIFIKIVTVPQSAAFQDLSDSMKGYWQHKCSALNLNSAEEEYLLRAGIYAEFGKITAVALGVLRNGELRTKILTNENEGELLNELIDLLEEKFASKPICFCGYNLKEFDLPFLSRRFLANQIDLPLLLLNLPKYKPWQYPHVDLLNKWKFGDRKGFTPLGLICEILGIEYNHEVAKVILMKESPFNDMSSINNYCQNEIEAISKLHEFYS
ncbi:3'-5' exonuclease [Cyclobacteriaceae bacterium]|nr:3'-5' exonuclease [Cyclobacteriaceae bacterium]